MQPVSPQPLLSEEDYRAIEAAVMETARGRWFLAEFARRNRQADTAMLLGAIARLERAIMTQIAPEPPPVAVELPSLGSESPSLQAAGPEPQDEADGVLGELARLSFAERIELFS